MHDTVNKPCVIVSFARLQQGTIFQQPNLSQHNYKKINDYSAYAFTKSGRRVMVLVEASDRVLAESLRENFK